MHASAAVDVIAPLSLGVPSTPVHRLHNLEHAVPGPRIYAKREDLAGLGVGGNKVRKLRFLMADAVASEATVVLTTGAVQSNHCSATALAAAAAGLRVELLLRGNEPATCTGNLRITSLVPARTTFLGDCDLAAADLAVQRRADALMAQGERPYVVAMGGSCPLGVYGTAHGVGEVLAQLPADELPTHIVVAAGSLGTYAGIVLGTWVYDLPCHVLGVSVLADAEDASQRAADLLEETRLRYFPSVAPRADHVIIDDELGDGYGIATEAGLRALHLLASTEGVLLDTTYTSKAMAGLLARVTSGAHTPADRVLFWHTGGLGGLLA